MKFHDQNRLSELPRPCHSERSEESASRPTEILRFAQNDMRGELLTDFDG
jgi:hypothetical protein